MKSRETTVDDAHGGTALVVHHVNQYTETVEVNHRQVLQRVKGGEWSICIPKTETLLLIQAAEGFHKITGRAGV